MFRIIANITIEVAVLTVLTLAPSNIAAQNNRQPEQKTQTLTGCIQRGEAVSAYKLVAKDGIWNLSTSKKLNIGRHVGHTVSVRGKVIESFDTKTVDRDGTKPAPRGILNISRIKLVSTTCTE